ncbi:MAG: phosphoribosylformylglycinamidine synthase [Candidatus Liptonbacteria bacterium]|nr:phosphoribosylformylglycinamidine synthase [Candidatus Liptonbacteria bacterium]
MPARIDIKYKVPDTRAAVKLRHLESIGFNGNVKSVDLVDSYIIDANLTSSQLQAVARLLENPLVERATVNQNQAPAKFDWAIEVGYLPGVTDNIGSTAKETIEDFLGKKFKSGQGTYSSQVFFLSGKLSEEDARRVADTLYNPLIQRAEIKSFKQFKKDGGMGISAPKVALVSSVSVGTVNLDVDDSELTCIGKEGIANPDGSRRGPLALDLDSMKTIREYFRGQKRKPTDIELESLAQTWSEHCKHTIFANPIDEIKDGIYRSYIKAATNVIRKKKGRRDFCVSVFTDNSGAIAFDDKHLVTHKVETHNAPSMLDPFGGAITGILGVNRDTVGFGLGAKPVANVYGFCFACPEPRRGADPRDPFDSTQGRPEPGRTGDKSVFYRDAERKEKILSARRIMEGVIQGVNVGGNCSGIPTPQGFMLFDKRYRGKPLVFAGTVGLIPRTVAGKPSHKKQAKPGDYIVMVGGRVGQDGIHGATFSSEAIDSGSPATAVQIGDPITQKKLSDAIVKEARDKKLYNSITDNGAGGLSCSVAEMARESNGCEVALDKVPLKYPGLAPWQIWISESQERMTLAVPKNKWAALHSLLEKRGVEATVIGRFTSSGKCAVNYRGKKIMDLDLGFLHDGWPRRHLATKETHPYKLEFVGMSAAETESRDLSLAIKNMLARPNIASYEFLSMQYDHEVQAGSVLKPLQGKGRVNGDASAVRPLLDSKKAIVLSSGAAPSYSEIDSYKMAACAIDTAIRSAVAAGADPDYIALLDNFCWCSSNEPERLYQLKRAAQACYDYAVAYETPFISGKDSMFNDFKGYDEDGKPVKISVPPTLLISAIGVVPDAEKTVSLDAKCPGDLVYALGNTYDEMAGSEYASLIDDKKHSNILQNVRMSFCDSLVPCVDAAKNRKLYRAFSKCVREGIVASAISVSKGGLAVALCKTAMGGKLGFDVSLKKLPGKFSNDTTALFSESQGRIIATVAPENMRKFEKLMTGTSFAKIGSVVKQEKIVIRRKKKNMKLPLPEILAAYKSTFANY